jgi:hypothetical protein
MKLNKRESEIHTGEEGGDQQNKMFFRSKISGSESSGRQKEQIKILKE